MAILAIDDEQVLALVAQLPSERKAWLLRALVSEQWPQWAELAVMWLPIEGKDKNDNCDG